MFSLPLPWIAAEVGWVVRNMAGSLGSSMAYCRRFSVSNVPASNVLFSPCLSGLLTKHRGGGKPLNY